MGTPSCFVFIFKKGDNFLGLSECLCRQFIGSTLHGKNLLQEEQILSELTAIKKGDKNENGRVASPESVAIHFQVLNFWYTTKKMQYRM